MNSSITDAEYTFKLQKSFIKQCNLYDGCDQQDPYYVLQHVSKIMISDLKNKAKDVTLENIQQLKI